MRELERAFIGRIIASATHEFMNIFAATRETSGLMEDLLSIRRALLLPRAYRLKQLLAKIQNQVNRGVEISEKLNEFAHSMDEGQKGCSLDELVTQACFLSRRFADLKRVQLHPHPVAPHLFLRTDPFLSQLVLVSCIEYCLGITDAGGAVSLRTLSGDQGVAIRVLTDNSTKRPEDHQAFLDVASDLEAVTGPLNAGLSYLDEPDLNGLELVFPVGVEAQDAE